MNPPPTSPPPVPPCDARRLALWQDLGELFLDTETRHELPAIAERALAAGWTPAEVGAAWRWEVTPALYLNLWSVAGEWAGWDADWLRDRIEGLRGRWLNRPGLAGELIYRARVGPLHDCWVALERALLLLAPYDPAERAARVADLSHLARVALDFVPPGDPLPAARRAALRACWAGDFQAVLGPLLGPLEAARGRRFAAGLAADQSP